MTIARTARVWTNEIRNKKNAHDTADYFKDVFTKDEFDEFYGELVDQTKECVKLEFQSLNILPSNNTMHEIFAWMDEHISYFELVDHIIDSIYTEIFQSVSGFFGKGCDDNQFEYVRDAMGNFSWGEHMDVYEYLLTEKNPKVTDWMGYVKIIESHLPPSLSLPAVKMEQGTMVEEKVVKEKIAYTENLSMVLKPSGTNLMYTIMNTSLYDGNMGVIVVEGISPRMLEEYGFDEDEINLIAQMGVGETFKDTMYGNGVVVVRLA